jgi:Lon protease-like protein
LATAITSSTTTTTNDKTINDNKIGSVITGATGIALFGHIELDELAQYCKRVNGQYLLRSFMPDDIEKILFVPSNIPELLKKKTKLDNDTKNLLEPGKIIYNLPLFSIGEIIFPGQELNVNIFEPRYRKMLKQCLEDSSYFGVNLVGSTVGTIVKVESITQINPITGEAQVTLRGCCRFKSLGKFVELEEGFGLISALKVQCFVDEESKNVPSNDELLIEAEGIIRYYIKAHNLDLPMSFFDSTEKISFFMAFLCTTFTSAPQKQFWLEQKDSYARLSEAVKLLREFTTAAYNKNM